MTARICKYVLAVIALCGVMSGCSLFKFSISTGETPLSSRERETRTLVRAFYNKFTADVVRTSDSISNVSPDIAIKRRAIRWKINATSACASAAFQTVPDIALVNTWVLTIQMADMMASTPDSLLFGSLSPMARTVAEDMKARAGSLAVRLLPKDRYPELRQFATEYAAANPVVDMNFSRADLALELTEYMNSRNPNGNAAYFAASTGLMSEVLADMNDRMAGLSQQNINEVAWSGELMKINLKNDSVALGAMQRVDSLMSAIRGISAVIEGSPGMVDTVTVRLQAQMAELVRELNRSMNAVFYNIGREREALQQFVADQRALMMQEFDRATQNAVKTITASVPGMVRDILVYVVLAVVVLFSVPFFTGYFIGRGRRRRE